ncbi:MAG: hypothetical protein R3A79_04070 [Nannocystaceae bacterium]
MATNGPIGERNLWVEVTDDALTEPVQLTFLRAGEPRIVRAVDIDGDGPRPIVGLERDDSGELREVPAFACLIEESGSGMAWLVYGGNAGVAVLAGALDLAAVAADPQASDHDFDGYLILAHEDLQDAENDEDAEDAGDPR